MVSEGSLYGRRGVASLGLPVSPTYQRTTLWRTQRKREGSVCRWRETLNLYGVLDRSPAEPIPLPVLRGGSFADRKRQPASNPVTSFPLATGRYRYRVYGEIELLCSVLFLQSRAGCRYSRLLRCAYLVTS